MNKSFKRNSGNRSSRKIFYIFTEGEVTEVSYFKVLEDNGFIDHQYRVQYRPPKRSSQNSIAALIKSACKESLRSCDELWVLLDHDPESHVQKQWEKLKEWKNSSKNRYVAISNPRFECWVCLHFSDSPNSCLSAYLPEYKKDLKPHQARFTRKNVQEAVKRAMRLAKSSDVSSSLPIVYNGSDVYVLVKRICGF